MFCEKISANLIICIVINTCSVNIIHFMVKKFFAAPYITDVGKKLIKIIISCFFQPFIIQHKTLDNVFLQTPCGANLKMGSNMGFYTVTYRYDHT